MLFKQPYISLIKNYDLPSIIWAEGFPGYSSNKSIEIYLIDYRKINVYVISMNSVFVKN